MATNVYRGERTPDGVRVTVNGRPLDPGPSRAVRDHSPDGFEWGYGGSGPAQLALAVLLEEYGRPQAERHYQEFKARVIAVLDPQQPWELTSADVAAVLNRLRSMAARVR